ncbi:MAG: sugar phosphate nucleotidyltransferase [Pseudomonadota bacterium]
MHILPHVYPVIMSGGIGSRLWPLSRQSRPKQFAPIFGGTSLFKNTVQRVAGLQGFRQLLVITGQSQAALVRKQLDELDIPATIILEPVGRESAPAVATAAAYLAQQDPDAIAVIVASDHHIPNVDHFHTDIARAVVDAEKGRIVTLGIAPDHPSSAYGYIKPADPDADVSAVSRFVEKPDPAVARGYLKEGYVWNSGNFIASATALLEEFQTRAPDVLAPVEAALSAAQKVPDGLLLGEAFSKARKISMDFAIMEHTDRASVLRSSMDWSDLGAWDSLYNAQDKDRDGNALVGDVLAVDSNDCSVRATDGRLTVLCDVEGLNVVVEDDVVLVSSLRGSQTIKQVVDRLASDKRSETDLPNLHLGLDDAYARLKSWFETAALPLWSIIGFDHELGLWRESLTLAGQPSSEPMRARVQGRQNTVFARGGLAGWRGPWQALLRHSAEGLANHYVLKEGRSAGLLRSLVSPDGSALDDTALLYDQSFQLLAEVNGAPQTGGEVTARVDPAEERSRLYEGLNTPLARTVAASFGEAGFGVTGLYREAPLDDADKGRHLANPVMHVFEVLLDRLDNLPTGTDDPSVAQQKSATLSEAQALVSFALKHFIDAKTGIVREVCDEAWQPITEGAAGQLEPGHHFEWAWLLIRYARLSGDARCVAIAQALYRTALFGYSPQSGAVVQFMDAAGRRTSQTARLWAQTEWLKASLALMHALPEDQSDLIKQYEGQAIKAVNVMLAYMQTDVHGLWYDKLHNDGTFVQENSPASSLYHIASAIDVLGQTVEQPVPCLVP